MDYSDYKKERTMNLGQLFLNHGAVYGRLRSPQLAFTRDIRSRASLAVALYGQVDS